MVEFGINHITAVGGKSINRLKFTNFRYKNYDKFLRIIVYGGMKVVQCKENLEITVIYTLNMIKPRSSLKVYRKLCLEPVAVV